MIRLAFYVRDSQEKDRRRAVPLISEEVIQGSDGKRIKPRLCEGSEKVSTLRGPVQLADLQRTLFVPAQYSYSILCGFNPFRAPEPLPILIPSNFVPKNGFPVVKGLRRSPRSGSGTTILKKKMNDDDGRFVCGDGAIPIPWRVPMTNKTQSKTY